VLRDRVIQRGEGSENKAVKDRKEILKKKELRGE